MRVIPLKLVPGTINVESNALSFRCGDGAKSIDCSITAGALDDILQYHRLEASNDDVDEALLNKIERILNAKSNAGRIGPDGSLVIKTIDVLRYGFREGDHSAA
jgi:hypothetical protein